MALYKTLNGRANLELSEADAARMNNPQLNLCCGVATFVKDFAPAIILMHL